MDDIDNLNYYEPATPETVLLTKEEYVTLKKSFDLLQCLYEQGVVNWEGYNVANNVHKQVYKY